MITFYDGASGRTRVTEHPATTTTANHGLSRIEQIRERLAELTQIPSHKQILLTPLGAELRLDETTKQLNWSLTDQQPLVVFSADFAIQQGELRLSQLPDVDEDFYHFSHLETTTVGQTSEVAQHIHDIDTKLFEIGAQYKDDCSWIIYSIHVATRNLEQVKSQYRAHLTHSMELLKFYEESRASIVAAVETAEVNVDELSTFTMPIGLKGGTALEYLESENPGEKNYDEIVAIIEQNVNRTTIQSINLAKKTLFELLHQEIRSLDELNRRVRALDEQYQLVTDRQVDQSRIRKSVELTASKSFSSSSRSPRDNSSQLRLMLNNHNQIMQFSHKCQDAKKWVYGESRAIIREIFSRQRELYDADCVMIKQLKRIQRIKELYSIIVTIPSVAQVRRVIDELYVQAAFVASYSQWHQQQRAKAESALDEERERRAELSDIQNGALRRLLAQVRLPRANQEEIGTVVSTSPAVVVLREETTGELQVNTQLNTVINEAEEVADDREVILSTETQTQIDNRDMATSTLAPATVDNVSKSINATVELCSRLVGSSVLNTSVATSTMATTMMHSVSTITEYEADDSRLEQLETVSAENRQSFDALVAQLATLESRVDQAKDDEREEFSRWRHDRVEIVRARDALDAQLVMAQRQVSVLTGQVALIEQEKTNLMEKCLSLERRKIVQVHRETSTTLSPPPPAITEQPLRMSQSVYVSSTEPQSTEDLMLSAMSQSVHVTSGPIAQHFHVLDNFQKDSPVCVVYNQERKHYILLTSTHQHFYFVHESCLDQLELPLPSVLADNSIRRFGKISDKPMHCVTRRNQNRYGIRAGTRFYRVKVMPH